MGEIKTRIVAGLLYRRIMDHCDTNRHGKNRRPPVTNAFKNSLEDLKNQPDLQSVLEEMGMNDTGAIGQEEEHGNDDEYAVYMRSRYRHVLSANIEIKAKEPFPEEGLDETNSEFENQDSFFASLTFGNNSAETTDIQVFSTWDFERIRKEAGLRADESLWEDDRIIDVEEWSGSVERWITEDKIVYLNVVPIGEEPED